MKALSDEQRKYLEEVAEIKFLSKKIYSHIRSRQKNGEVDTTIDAREITDNLLHAIHSVLLCSVYSTYDAKLFNLYLRDFMKNKFDNGGEK